MLVIVRNSLARLLRKVAITHVFFYLLELKTRRGRSRQWGRSFSYGFLFGWCSECSPPHLVDQVFLLLDWNCYVFINQKKPTKTHENHCLWNVVYFSFHLSIIYHYRILSNKRPGAYNFFLKIRGALNREGCLLERGAN